MNMSVFSVSYDLHTPGRNYAPLYEGIKKLGSWNHLLESMWLVQTQLSEVDVRDRLRKVVDSNDSIFVVRVVHPWASLNISEDCVAWLRRVDSDLTC